MPVAALQVAVVQGLEERPALVEEVFNLLPLSLGVGFWGGGDVSRAILLRKVFCAIKQPKRIDSSTPPLTNTSLASGTIAKKSGIGMDRRTASAAEMFGWYR